MLNVWKIHNFKKLAIYLCFSIETESKVQDNQQTENGEEETTSRLDSNERTNKKVNPGYSDNINT